MVSGDEILELLDRAHDLGFDLEEIGGPLEQLTIAELAQLVSIREAKD
jgi:hypothetical protein